MPTHTPWGLSDHSEVVARGIVFYSTPSHGAYHLTANRVQQLPPSIKEEAQKHGFITAKGDAWFEEDCAYSLVVLGFPEHFTEKQLEAAHKSAKNWHPDAWMGLTATPLPLSESRVLRERVFNANVKNLYVGVSAYGSWAEHVPEGMAGVHARLGGRSGTDLAGSNWLVPEAEYQDRHKDPRHEFGFIIDPARHQRVDVEFGPSKQKSATVQKMLAEVALAQNALKAQHAHP